MVYIKTKFFQLKGQAFSSCSGSTNCLQRECILRSTTEVHLNRGQVAGYQSHYSNYREYTITKSFRGEGQACDLGPGTEHKKYS